MKKFLIGDDIPVEGYYTQNQIRDIVDFAKTKYITIVPEIDLPGHSSAEQAACLEYGCKENYSYRVQTTWGGFPDIYCPTEPTLQFIEGVLSEVIDLFPIKVDWNEIVELRIKVVASDGLESSVFVTV